MIQGDDPGGDGAAAFAAAGSALAARDAELAGADRELAAALDRAHRRAAESIGRLDAVGAEIDSAVRRTRDGTAAAHELARLLLAKQRETIAILGEARTLAADEAAVWNDLIGRYR